MNRQIQWLFVKNTIFLICISRTGFLKYIFKVIDCISDLYETISETVYDHLLQRLT